MESKPSLNGLCLRKTENVNAHSDQKVNQYSCQYLSFPSLTHHLIFRPKRQQDGYRTTRNTRGWTLSGHLGYHCAYLKTLVDITQLQ